MINRTNFGISFSDEAGNKISLDDIIEQLNKKLSNNNMLGWASIIVAISLAVPSSLAFVAFDVIKSQDKKLERQYQRIEKLEEKLYNIDKELVKLSK